MKRSRLTALAQMPQLELQREGTGNNKGRDGKDEISGGGEQGSE